MAIFTVAWYDDAQIVAGNSPITVSVDDPQITADDSDFVDIVTVKVTNDRLVARTSEGGIFIPLSPASVAVRVEQPPAAAEDRDLVTAYASKQKISVDSACCQIFRAGYHQLMEAKK